MDLSRLDAHSRPPQLGGPSGRARGCPRTVAARHSSSGKGCRGIPSFERHVFPGSASKALEDTFRSLQSDGDLLVLKTSAIDTLPNQIPCGSDGLSHSITLDLNHSQADVSSFGKLHIEYLESIRTYVICRSSPLRHRREASAEDLRARADRASSAHHGALIDREIQSQLLDDADALLRADVGAGSCRYFCRVHIV